MSRHENICVCKMFVSLQTAPEGIQSGSMKLSDYYKKQSHEISRPQHFVLDPIETVVSRRCLPFSPLPISHISFSPGFSAGNSCHQHHHHGQLRTIMCHLRSRDKDDDIYKPQNPFKMASNGNPKHTDQILLWISASDNISEELSQYFGFFWLCFSQTSL